MYSQSKPILALLLLVCWSVPLFNSMATRHVVAESLFDTPVERARVRIVDNNVVTDNGAPLRGEHLIFGTEENDTDNDAPILYDEQFWRQMRNEYGLNTIRLMLSRPPQNWTPDLGANCQPPTFRCYPLDYIHSGSSDVEGKSTLLIMDDLVNIAGRLGMYIIIDYHPVFGYDRSDAVAWWGEVAPRYAERTHVIYELANEPYPNTEYPTDIIDFQEELYLQIRADAPDTHIILWSFPVTDSRMASTVAQGAQISYENASVAYHPYGEYDSSDPTGLREQYPIIATEIGGNRIEMTNAAESIGVSWIWLDGVAQKPGIDGVDDNYRPDDVTWPRDPYAIDQSAPTPTPTPLSTATLMPPPTNTPTSIPDATPDVTPDATPQTAKPAPTPLPTPTPTPISCDDLSPEAEHGTLWGTMFIGEDLSASFGEYVSSPETNDSPAQRNLLQRATADALNNENRVDYCITVNNAGEYRIRTRAFAQSYTANSFHVQIDGEPSNGILWDIYPVNGTYVDSYVSDRGRPEYSIFELGAGTHILSFIFREAGTRLDSLTVEPVAAQPGAAYEVTKDEIEQNLAAEVVSGLVELNKLYLPWIVE